MSKPIHVLILEDRATDADILIHELRHAGFDPQWKRVETKADFLVEIKNSPDIILSDYSMPQFNGLEAAKLLQESGQDIPFILISGTVGEDVAVEAMRHGATDYLLKDRIARLGSAVERALQEAETNRKRRQAEAELRWKTALLEAQMHSSLDGILVVDSQGKKILQNQRMSELWKIPPHVAEEENDAVQVEFVTKQTKHPAQFADKVAYLYSHPDAISRDEIELVDGTVLDRYSAPIRDQPGNHYGRIWSFRDITERKRMEESHARLAMSVEQASENIVITDTRGTILYANPAFEKLTGYTVAEALGKTPRILKSGKHDAEFYRQMWDALKRGEVWRGHMINRNKNGTFYEEEATISPVRDASGKIVNYVAVKRDVTREMQLETQFRQSQKMESIGQLAGGVAHDFNNILAAMMMQTELTGMIEGLPEEVRTGLGEIRGGAERAANLTRQLLLFGRRQVMQPRQLDLNESVTSLARMLQRILGEDIRLQLNLHPKPVVTHADAGMLDQVLMNLAVNARDAMPGGGQLTLETAEKVLDEAQAQMIAGSIPGRFVMLKVSDTGCGIPPENLARIFEPFFTTKEIGKGTGLGLATVFGIVKQHNGWLQVHSVVGKGAAFEVFLPASDATAAATPKPAGKSRPTGGGETILLVEDDLAVRTLTRVVLERHGYRVVDAGDGVEALNIWPGCKDRVALLLTDLVMPEGVTGQELAAKLEAEKPDLKTIFCSGYSTEIAGRELKLRPGQRFLQKPFPPDQLLEAVRNLLDA